METNYSFDFVNLDIQGAELNALKGMGQILNNVNYIYLEVNLISIYKKCPKLHSIDLFLARKGFCRVELKLTNAFWGDAFYIRQERNTLSKYLANICQAYYWHLYASIKQIRDRFYLIRQSFRIKKQF
ncbi:MAG: FkbM family methyltransferase [Cyclobacteriaceae bacterium]|nr:FkbM family methyltransferase [Cyclobacteriaceae bacterium]